MEALKFMSSEAGMVAQFRRMQERAFDAPAEGPMTAELEAFFQRMHQSFALEVWNDYASLPEFLERIVPRYLIWIIRNRKSSLDLARKLLVKFMKIPLLEDSKAHGSVRGFVWIERDRVIETAHMPKGSQMLQSWTGSNVVIDAFQIVSELDGQMNNQLVITKAKLDGVEFYAWELRSVRKHPTAVKTGFEEKLEWAAERCYRAFYHWFTEYQFAKAREFKAGREVILAGNEVSSEQFLKSPSRISCTVVPETGDHDREGTMFVLNWPASRRQKRTYKIKDVSGQRPSSKGTMTLHGGLKLDLDMDVTCYVKCPEQYVNAEIMCPKCETLGFVGSLAMKYVQSYGPVCGPCIDNCMELGELHEAQFD